jgi:hypothetical protein
VVLAHPTNKNLETLFFKYFLSQLYRELIPFLNLKSILFK